MNNYKGIILKARKLGTRAFLEGRKRAPILDSRVIDLAQGLKNVVRIEVFKAYLLGWDEVNLYSVTFRKI